MTRDAKAALLFWSVVAFVIGGSLLWLFRDDRLDRPIRIVLPVDYSGEFTIVKDACGRPYKKRPDAYVFSIPDDGRLLTPDVSPFFRWHRLEYGDAEGRPIAVEPDGTKEGMVQVAPNHWVGSTDYDGTTMHFKVLSPAAIPSAARP